MKERTDQEWIRQLKQDDPESVTALWEMLFHFAWQAAKQQRASTDMAHDAAIAAYNRIRQRGVTQYKFACPFPGYCRVIVVRELLRLYKKQPPITIEIDDKNEERIGQTPPPRLAKTNQIQARLQPCLEHLPQNILQVIELLYFNKNDPESVAQKLGIRRNYVNQLAHRGRKQLRHCLESQGYLTVGDVMSL